MIALVSVNASRNGLASSQFAPMPLNSSKGGRALVPCLIATLSTWSPIAILRTSMSAGPEGR
jgi:hypothetical protein